MRPRRLFLVLTLPILFVQYAYSQNQKRIAGIL